METTCEVAVLIVNTTQPNDISYFALRVFQKNEIGKQGQDNGVLIVVAVDDGTWKVIGNISMTGRRPHFRLCGLSRISSGLQLAVLMTGMATVTLYARVIR